MKRKMLEVGLIIGYLCFFVVMDILVIAIQNSFNTMESLSYGSYSSRIWGMVLIGFLKWFVLGFLLYYLSENKKLRFKIDIIYLVIALAGTAIYIMINLCILVPVPAIYSGKFMTQLISLISTLAGFFMFKGLFAGTGS
ncbi:MAG: hypothetical protein PWP56_1620 [Acetobacterium sp.]|nr:hypothetical protein [Acetobacterium sp.]